MPVGHHDITSSCALQVDKDTMEMLKQIGMGNLPNVTVPQVRWLHVAECLVLCERRTPHAHARRA